VGAITPRLICRYLARLVPVATVALLLVPLPADCLGIWQGKLLDFGHVPLFAAFVLALRIGWGLSLGRALALAILSAGLAEIVQPWAGRTGDWADFLRGGLGALAAAAAIRAYKSRKTPLRAAGYLALGFAFVVWPVVEVAPYAIDTVEGRREFPVLAEFSTERDLLRWECTQATLALDADGARLELFSGSGEYSGAALRPAVSDFSGYRRLCWEFRVAGEPADLVVSVRTSAGGEKTAHAQVGRRYGVGTHVARFDLAAMAARGQPSPLDLSNVRYVQLFAVRLTETRTVVLHRVWLEP
jgi:hypothetical protein